MKDTNLLTISEVADYFKLNKSTLYFLAKKGKVPAFKIGKQWRFHKEHLDSWIHGNFSNVNKKTLELQI